MVGIMRRLFGYDFFISYSRGDAQGYAKQLHETLGELGYRVFIDHEELLAGQELTDAIQAALAKSTMLVVIVSPGAMERPTWIEKEVQLFTSSKRTVVAISLHADLSDEATHPLLQLLGERLRLIESDLDDRLRPSQQTVSQLARTLQGPRIERRRTQALGITSLVLAILAGLAVWFGIAEQTARSQAQREAVTARKQSASRYAVQAQAALASNPDEAMQLARRGVEIFQVPGDPLVPAAMSALQQVLQGSAGQPLGKGRAVFTSDEQELIFIDSNQGEIIRYQEPARFGLTRPERSRVPAEFAGTPGTYFVVDNEVFVLTRTPDVGDAGDLDRTIYRQSDWQPVHRFRGDHWETDYAFCRPRGLVAVIRKDRVELLDPLHPGQPRGQWVQALDDPLVQFSDNCDSLAIVVPGAARLIDTSDGSAREFRSPATEPLSAGVHGNTLVLLDIRSQLWRLTDQEPDPLGSLFGLHADLIEMEGTPFNRFDLSGDIEISDDGDAVLAQYRVRMDEDFADQQLGMAGVFSLSGAFPPWSARQGHAALFGGLAESSSSSFNDEILSQDSLLIKDLSRFGVQEGRFLPGEHAIVTLGFQGDLVLQSGVHERVRLAKEVSSYATSPDRRWIITGHNNGDIRFWEWQHIEPSHNVPTHTWHGHAGAVQRIWLSASSPLLVSHDREGRARLWHQAHPRLGTGSNRETIAGDSFLLTRDLENNLYLWDLKAGQPFAAPLSLDELPMRAYAFRFPWLIGLHIMPTPGAARLRLWNLDEAPAFGQSQSFALQDERWIQILQRAHADDPELIPDAPWMELLVGEGHIGLAAGRISGKLQLFRSLMGLLDLRSGTNSVSLANTLMRPGDYRYFESSNKGRWLATLDKKGLFRLWQFSQAGKAPVQAYEQDTKGLNQVLFSSNDDRLLLRLKTQATAIDLDTMGRVELTVEDADLRFVDGTAQLIGLHENNLTLYGPGSDAARSLSLSPTIQPHSLVVTTGGRHALATDANGSPWWYTIDAGRAKAQGVALPAPTGDLVLAWTAAAVGDTAIAATLKSGGLLVWYRDPEGGVSEPVVIHEPDKALHESPRVRISNDGNWLTVDNGERFRLRPLSLQQLNTLSAGKWP